ncbi:hypothetical protein [Legionella worsleiensis]|nr:hypothetical protein [Legionella worsleiensis]
MVTVENTVLHNIYFDVDVFNRIHNPDKCMRGAMNFAVTALWVIGFKTARSCWFYALSV